MSTDLSGELSKLKKDISKAGTLLSYATKLRPIHISSKSKINDLIFDESHGEADRSYMLRTKPVSIQLKEQRFVAKLEITLFDRKPIKLSYIDTLGKSYEKTSRKFHQSEEQNNYVLVFNICAPIKELSISTVTGEASLKKIEGFLYNETTTSQYSAVALSKNLKRLHDVQETASSLYKELLEKNNEVEQKISKLNVQEKNFDRHKSSLRDELEEAQQELEDSTNELSSIQDTLSTQISKLAKAEASLDLTRTETESLASANETYRQELEQKRSLIRTENSKLQQLQKDVDVFSEDLKSFTGETRKQHWFYGAFFLLLFGLLSFITQHLFVRAGDLIVSFDEGNIKNIWDVLISRIPFTLATLGILTLIAEGMRRCINQIVQIHDQRLTFLRLSILAREIVDTSTHELDIEKEELVKLRTKLKLAMLRKHMEKDLGSKPTDIENEPTKIISIKNDEQAA